MTRKFAFLTRVEQLVREKRSWRAFIPRTSKVVMLIMLTARPSSMTSKRRRMMKNSWLTSIAIFGRDGLQTLLKSCVPFLPS